MPTIAKIVIIGSGPAGAAAAAALFKKDPQLIDDILILEKEHHPRHKLCGGGLTPWADEMLELLDLQVEVPSCPLKSIDFYLNDKPVTFASQNIMRTIRRDEFDAALVQKIRDRGMHLLEGVKVTDIQLQPDKVMLETTAGEIHADILVGADGVKSLVRRKFMRENPSRISRLIEVLVPIEEKKLTPEFRQQKAVLDFRPINVGLQGYIWDFPSYIDGKPVLNVGIFDSRVNSGERADLPALLRAHLQSRGFDGDYKLHGWPERWYHPVQQISCPRVVVTGDAAGIEPWLGEGISTALSYGPIVADAVFNALQTNDLSFSGYRLRMKKSRLGWYISRKRNVAQLIYRPGFYKVLPMFGRILSCYMNLKKW
ncbi:MAG: NAD(P)/FAD-dependent oxidoreductase [Calditrichaeota bacterium]|nr:MAG: NAD(P)/FAD-dependent oxidoreductase [Calditrichota bacterium]